MIVEKVDGWNIREPGGRRSYLLLKVTSRDGVAGWGEGPPLSPQQLAALRQAAVGRPLHAYRVVHAGLAGQAGSGALDMALLDALARTGKAPLFQLLGGPTRNKVRACTDWSPEAARAGHRAFVTALPPMEFPNPRGQFISRVKQSLEALRKEVGDSADFIVDGANQLPPGEAANVSAALEKLHPMFFDEPCAIANLEAVRKLAEENVTPLGWGRNVTRLAEIQDLLREQAVDVVRLDLSRHGFTGLRTAAALAETYYVGVAPYHRGGPVGTAAAIHLAASLPNFVIQQLPWAHGEDAKARAELVGGEIERVKDGFLALPQGPGLGIQVSEAAIRRYAL